MSSWISASSSPKRNSASALDSSVLPTPEGPAKMNEPPGRFGSLRPARVRRIACDSALIASLLADDPLVQLVLHAQQARGLLLGQLEDRDAGGSRPAPRRSSSSSTSATTSMSPAFHSLLARRPSRRGAVFSLSRSDAAFSKSCASIAALLLAADVGDLLVELAQVRRRGHPADAQPRAGLVDQVDRLVRQEPVVDVAVGQRGRRDERARR